MTERERYLVNRIPIVRGILRELERELREIREREMEAYYQQLDGCNPAKAEAMRHD